MIGLFYMGWVMVSHVGAKIKEFNHYVNRHIDKQTNTYVDRYGVRRDNATGQLRTMLFKDSGDIVLLDKKHRVVRNVSQEERMQKWKERREDPARDLIMETTLKTKELRTTHPISPTTNEQMYVKGPVYIDLATGEEYYKITVNVEKKYCGNKNDRFKDFYVNVNNPFELIRISDEQKAREKRSKGNGYFNWLDHPEMERDFIKDYNNRPFSSYDLLEKTKNIFINPI